MYCIPSQSAISLLHFLQKNTPGVPYPGNNKQELRIQLKARYLSIMNGLFVTLVLDHQTIRSSQNIKIMKKTILLPLIATFLFFSSCEKGLDGLNLDFNNINWGGVTIYTNVFDSTLSYIQLPENHYYIYKEEASGTIDSVKATKSLMSWVYKNPLNNNPGYYHYNYELILTSFSQATPQTWYNGRAFCDSDYKNMVTFIDKDFNLSNEPSKVPAFWCPFTSAGNQQYLYMSGLVVEGITYVQVHKFQASNGLPASDPNYLETAFYWVKGIGIIRREIKTFNSVKTFLLLRHGQL